MHKFRLVWTFEAGGCLCVCLLFSRHTRFRRTCSATQGLDGTCAPSQVKSSLGPVESPACVFAAFQ